MDFTTSEIFQSREALIKWAREVGRTQGFLIVIKKSDVARHGKKGRILLSCERSGTYSRREEKIIAEEKSNQQQSRTTGTKKCGCPFLLKGKQLSNEEGWVLLVACSVHNHSMTSHFEGHSFAGRLTKEEEKLVVDMSKTLVRPRDILHILKKRDNLNVSTIRTIYNARKKFKIAENGGRSQMHQLMNNPSEHAYIEEGLILLIDVGPSMHGVLPEVEKLCSMLVQKKLIFGKSDEVGIILFGTEDTDNDLEKEVGGYEHVVVLRNVKVVDGDAVDILQNLPRGIHNGDFLDAVIVGMDTLTKKYGNTNKGKQCLCLITDARHPIKAPSEGTKEDQVHIVCQQMQAHGMRLDCIIVRENSAEDAHQKIIDENDYLLKQFSQRTKAKAVHVCNSTALLGALRTRNVSPVTVFRGDLELSSTMKFKVLVYKKTSEEKFPTLKKYSDKAPPTDKYATHEVKVDFKYKSMEDTDKIVPPEQRIKGYRYGPQVVPISSAEWDTVKFKPEKSVKLLGFTDVSNIMRFHGKGNPLGKKSLFNCCSCLLFLSRHYYMKDVYIFIPEPGNGKAIVASSAIARAMKEMNKVAILRCVWRQGQGNVVVGVLTPNISCMDSIPDSFYFNVLPFAEDVREFQFPSFSTFPSLWQPNEQQQEAADNLVRVLDLVSPGKEEVLQPDFTPNPVLERFYRFLDLKSRKSDAEVPPLERSLKRITEPDPELLLKYKPAIDNFCSQFELKENSKKKKSSRQAWREKSSASDEAGANDKVPNNGSAELIKDSSLVKVEKIGDLNPVQDFEAMMAQRDSSKWVNKAIKEMQGYTYNLLENSYEGNTYPKAIECLIALRKGCILEQEPREFNRYLRHMYEKWKVTDLVSFFELLPSKNVTLISKSEADDSDVTDEEANKFPVRTELAPQ